jgi:hypothetical protein
VNLFRDLLTETDRRVKDSGIKAHGVILQVAGRKVAPYLKQLAGPWVLLMHDPHRSCKKSAIDSFNQVIPQAKHQATWVFCKTELIGFIRDRFDGTFMQHLSM